MNRCSKVTLALCLQNTKSFYRANFASRASKKLTSVQVKPKTRRALGIAVDFVGDHLKDKKATEFNTLDKLLSEDLGLLIPFPTIQVIPPESVRSAC